MLAISADNDKAQLRSHFSAIRSEYFKSSGERVRPLIESNLMRLIKDLSDFSTQVALYRPLRSEAFFTLSGEFFYPRLTEPGRMQFFKGDHFERNKWGIEEPLLDQDRAMSDLESMIVVCPALAVDRHGTRLGMGQGYYDRFFNDHPHAVRVGLVYQVQMAKQSLPKDSWDQPLDWIVTEEMILRVSQRRS